MIRAIVADIDPSKVKGGDASGANYRIERVRLQLVTQSLANDPQCPPTMIVDTGGGIQLWWQLPKPVPVTPEENGPRGGHRTHSSAPLRWRRGLGLAADYETAWYDQCVVPRKARARPPACAGNDPIGTQPRRCLQPRCVEVLGAAYGRKGKNGRADADARYPMVDMAAVRAANGYDALPSELRIKFESETCV